MKYLGTINNVTNEGMLIVQVEFTPPNDKRMVVDQHGKPVGKIKRVFGPTRSPYISIRPTRERGDTLVGIIGKKVYLE